MSPDDYEQKKNMTWESMGRTYMRANTHRGLPDVIAMFYSETQFWRNVWRHVIFKKILPNLKSTYVILHVGSVSYTLWSCALAQDCCCHPYVQPSTAHLRAINKNNIKTKHIYVCVYIYVCICVSLRISKLSTFTPFGDLVTCPPDC